MNSALFGVVAALAWGVHDFLARFPARAVGPVPTVFAVTVSGFVFLSLWLVINGADLHILRLEIWLVAASGICLALATLSLFTALALGPISIVAPIAGSYPALAMMIALAQGAWPNASQWAAIAAVMAGVVIVSRSGGHFEKSGALPRGQLATLLSLSFGASVGFALALSSGQAAAPHFGDIETVWLSRIFGLITIGAILLAQSSRPRIPARWLPLLGLMGGLDVTALGTIVAAGSLAEPEFATVVSSAFGAVTVVLARLFLKEPITPAQLAGMALIFGGVAVLASS
jgi:drug/metabolite transporter (DMT)-like permease